MCICPVYYGPLLPHILNCRLGATPTPADGEAGSERAEGYVLQQYEILSSGKRQPGPTRIIIILIIIILFTLQITGPT